VTAGPVASGGASGTPLIALRGVTRTYSTGRMEVPALRGVDVDVWPGEFVAIVGHSGSGKTTLMNIIGCLDRPTDGTYRIQGVDVSSFDDDDLARIRSRTIGFVFQNYNLLPRTSALENVATPLLYQGVGRRERLERAKGPLERLGLGDRLTHEPSELSGGQQQRVAIARALVTEPALILADEPTGNLDTASGEEVMAILHQLNDEGRTIVLITHEADVAVRAQRQIHVRDGRIVS
jgi:putative ABC transport system ATP-binding protein